MRTSILKTLSIVLLFLACGINLAQSQNQPASKEGSEVLADLLLRPLGIDKVFDNLDMSAVESSLTKKGLDYKTLNMGAYGNVISVYPTDFNIGGVGISRIIFMLNEYAKMVMYESVQSQNYPDVCKAVEGSLDGYAVTRDLTEDGDRNLSTLMLSDSLGVSVGSMPEKQISIIYIMDMQNLNGFLNQ